MLVFIGENARRSSSSSRFELDSWARVKLHHMESAHNQLYKAGSHGAIAFARKYGINGPIPEGLNNYLDVSDD